ncbi:MAG: hypothetical protein RJA52_769 [Bacteroidota bacterium]|jgi:hypothetical protein
MYKYLFAVVIFYSCNRSPVDSWKSLDLLPHGVPLKVLAPLPDSAKVNKSDMGTILQDITIKNGDDYFIQIFATQAETTDLAKIKAAQMADVKSNRFYSKIVKEEEAGFIYELMIDSANVNYGFRFIKIQGGMEYIFQPGMSGIFTLDQAQNMYKGVQ